MIDFQKVTHVFGRAEDTKIVLDHFDGHLASESYVLLASSERVRSEFLRLCLGSRLPQSGAVVRQGKVSWPIGNPAVFRYDLSGYATARFFASIYRLNPHDVIDFLTDFAALPDETMASTVRLWPTPLALKLNLALALLPGFDIYAVEGSPLHPDIQFQRRWLEAFEARIDGRMTLISTTQIHAVRRLCRLALIVHNGKVFTSPNVAEAVGYFGLRTIERVPEIEEEPLDSADDPI